MSKKGLFLCDKKSEEIWKAQEFSFRGKAKSKWLAYYMGIRAAVFDEWVQKQFEVFPDAVVIHIGCGLDSRVLRVGDSAHKWYDVDFREVIEERKRYYTESESYQMIAGDVREESWLTNIPEKKSAIVVMEGVSMYLTLGELRTFTQCLCAKFEQITLLMDCYTDLGARMSKYKNPVRSVGVTEVYGIQDPVVLEQGNFTFSKEYTMVPQKYIEELTGIEKRIFKNLYAGKFSQKLYRMFAYGKR